jgi:predicted phosphodiesterase
MNQKGRVVGSLRVALASDVHLEFGDLDLKNNDGADVLVLAGDICVARELPNVDSRYHDRFHEFFARCAAEFKNVIYIAGNHEHYHGNFDSTLNIMREQLSKHNNIHVMEKEMIDLGDVTFLAGTLWTDFNKEDRSTMRTVTGVMNDFNCITAPGGRIHSWVDADRNLHYRDSKLSPEDLVKEHKDMLHFIDSVITSERIFAADRKYVVVGHHSPSKLSTKPQYEDDWEVNGAYSSDLTKFIKAHPEIKVWVHGHSHSRFSYMVGNTHIIANPRGYVGYESVADNFSLISFDINEDGSVKVDDFC